MAETTVLYCTSNREDEVFEQKIKNKLLDGIGDKPLLSVSQKPIVFGHNICVGDVGASYRNLYLQLRIGALAATTDYIQIVESDQLYPPGYFEIEPRHELYMYKSLYVLRHWDPTHFLQKEYGVLTVIVSRLFLLYRLELQLGKIFEWGQSPRIGGLFHKRRWAQFDVGAPVITVKTPNGLSSTTGSIVGVAPVLTLPHWGSAAELSRELGL